MILSIRFRCADSSFSTQDSNGMDSGFKPRASHVARNPATRSSVPPHAVKPTNVANTQMRYLIAPSQLTNSTLRLKGYSPVCRRLPSPHTEIFSQKMSVQKEGAAHERPPPRGIYERSASRNRTDDERYHGSVMPLNWTGDASGGARVLSNDRPRRIARHSHPPFG